MQKMLQTKKVKSERNYGIDLLRIIAMFFVVIVHCLRYGGTINGTVENSMQYNFCCFIDVLVFVAVDIFALISGYVSYREKEKSVKYSNYINIWFQVVFYGIMVTAVFNIFNPEAVTLNDYIYTLFPVSNNLYWYFTAYTGLFAIMPFLNKGIRNCSKETLKKMFIVIIIVFSFWNIISNTFTLNNGYSFVWITLLYILGAIIKKCEIGKTLKGRKIVIGILAMYLITYLYRLYGFEVSAEYITIDKGLLVNYTSPTILIASILYLIGFSKIRFNKGFKAIVKFAAPSAFNIYILNNHRLIWNYIMKDLFIELGTHTIVKIFIYIMGFSGLFVIGSILIDKIRIFIFKILNIKGLSEKISKVLNKLVGKIASYI